MTKQTWISTVKIAISPATHARCDEALAMGRWTSGRVRRLDPLVRQNTIDP